MASKVGIVKDISDGAATAVDSSGNKRALNNYEIGRASCRERV